MNALKRFLSDFPNQNGAVVVGLSLILITGLVVDVKLMLGQPFPDGYETWIWALMTLAGINTAGMIGKRATDVAYKAAGTPSVTVEAPSTVTVSPSAPPSPEP